MKAEIKDKARLMMPEIIVVNGVLYKIKAVPRYYHSYNVTSTGMILELEKIEEE